MKHYRKYLNNKKHHVYVIKHLVFEIHLERVSTGFNRGWKVWYNLSDPQIRLPTYPTKQSALQSIIRELNLILKGTTK